MTAEQSEIEQGLRELVPFWAELDQNQRAFLSATCAWTRAPTSRGPARAARA